jgi:hypothetical protein
MIEIASRCGHHRDCLKGIVMRVISGDLQPDLAIACPTCGKVCILILEIEEKRKAAAR